ncbi:MAG: biotin/lipoyl-containing protein, partial [Solirubrobacterales bacterium]
MATTATVQVLMPEMGESVTEGTVLEWHVAEGEFVEEGQTVVEVSTDKVDAEVPAPASGTVTKINAQPDEEVAVGQPLAELDTSGVAPDGGDGQPAAAPAAEPAESGEEPATKASNGGGPDSSGGAGQSVSIFMPEMGESVTEGTVLEYHVAEGDSVEEGQTVVEVSTDKVDAEIPAPAAGTITKISAQPDETVSVGAVLAEMTAGPGGGGGGADAPAAQPAVEDADGAKATPVARRIAQANAVDLGSIKGTGAGGKVTKTDVLAASSGDGKAAAKPAAVGEGEAKPLRGPAGMLAAAMNESLSIPTATSFRTLAVDTLDAKRKALNSVLKERGMKVSFTHLIAWALVNAATEWPVMGRAFEEREGKPHVIEPQGIGLGIAVDVERKGGRSLMVPCIKGADSLDFAGFHSYYEELITKTRENKLTADDFQGTNITLTNPGGLGTIASVPR